MLLKILLLQVMSIGLITLRIEAQEATPDRMPDLFMTDMDKLVMGKIWNIAGYTNGDGTDTQVERKFFKQLLEVAPQIAKSAQPFLAGIPQLDLGVKAIGTLAPVVSDLLSGQRRNEEEKATFGVPGMSQGYSPMMPYPMAYPASVAIQNNQNIQQYRVQPKPPNSELDSSEEDEPAEGDVEPTSSTNRRRLHQENTEWEDGENQDNEDDTKPRNLENEHLPLERRQRIMQFEKTNATKIDTQRRTLEIRRLKNYRTSKNNNPTTLSPDVETSRPHHGQNTSANKNSHRETQRNNNNERKHYMHKKKYYQKTANATRNASKRKEPNRKPDKSLETRKYYEMLENSQKYMCKCNINEEKHRRKSEEMNGRRSYMERSMDFRHDQVFNCTKYCSATEGKDVKSNEKPNGRLRIRYDKDREHPREGYHKTKRENEDEDIEEEEAVRPRTTHSRRLRNKHRNHEFTKGSDRGSTEGYFYSTSTEAEEMVNDEIDEMDLPNEKQFEQNVEYRSSIDPVEAYAEESAYRYRYPEEELYHSANDRIRRHVDESDYTPRMNDDYRSRADARMTKNVHPIEYLAWSPIEVLHNVKGYNPMIHQYPYNPYMYEPMQDIRSLRNKVTT